MEGWLSEKGMVKPSQDTSIYDQCGLLEVTESQTLHAVETPVTYIQAIYMKVKLLFSEKNGMDITR